MRLLAIDTSSPLGSVAIVEEERLVAELSLDVEYTHSRRLMRDVDLVLKAVGLTIRQIDGFALTLGPGSFTGLRIGVATVKGMAMVSEKPIAGVVTLDALAQNLFGTACDAWALIDARKGEVFAARYVPLTDRMERSGEPLLLKPAELLQHVQGPSLFLGSGVPLCEGPLREALGDLPVFAPRHLWPIRAAVVAALGRAKIEAGEVEDLATFGPLYLRASEAELKSSEDV